MALSTYSELVTSVSGWLLRDDLADAVPDFITLAEAQIARDVRHWRMETRATATIDSRYTALPTDWLETIRLHIGDAKDGLALVSLADMQDLRYRDADATGEPRYYAHVAGEFEVYPTPGSSYTGEVLYYAKVPALSEAAPTNWLLTYAPDVYLYGSLIQSAPYLKDDERAAVWASFYSGAVTRLNSESAAARWSGTGLKMRGRM